MIEVKGTKTEAQDTDPAEAYRLDAEKKSKSPFAIGVVLMGIALYLKSMFPADAEPHGGPPPAPAKARARRRGRGGRESRRRRARRFRGRGEGAKPGRADSPARDLVGPDGGRSSAPSPWGSR